MLKERTEQDTPQGHLGGEPKRIVTVREKRETLVRLTRHGNELQGLPHHDLPDPTTIRSKRQWEKEMAIWRMKSRRETDTFGSDKQDKHAATTKMYECELTTSEIEGTPDNTKAI